MNDVFYAYAYFVIYAFLGWVCEDIYCGIGNRKWVNRGFLYGPYCPIYGIGALLVIYPLLMVQYHPILVFVFGIVITSVLEYITSWIMEKLFHTRWWDYSQYPLNINGRVCLRNSILFGILCLVVIFLIHPQVERLVQMIPLSVLVGALFLFTIAFVVDIVLTVIALLKRKKVFQKIKEDVDTLRFEFEKDKQEKLEELSQSFELWLEDRPEIQERIDRLRLAAERLEELQKTHISHAFPQRRLQQNWDDLARFAKELKEKYGVKK